MLRLQKPEPCVDLMPAAAWAGPLINTPGPAPMVMVIAAVAPFRNLRRDAAGAPEKSMSCNLGKCVQPIRSHMTCLLDQSVGVGRVTRCLGSDDSLPAVEQDSRREIVGTPTEENRRGGLRYAGIVQALCHQRPSRAYVRQQVICCTAHAQILVN